ncbi:MAG: hypothetical protein HGA33_03565, partial [Candidatus Moranbacteria bacterium]|nr:hypothetical protein [Candidatus Moranbacteria bacterium]
MLISDEEFEIKLEKMFDNADLSEEDRGLWRARLVDAGEYVHKMFVDVFLKDRDLLLLFTRNMRKLAEAQGDREKIDEVE